MADKRVVFICGILSVVVGLGLRYAEATRSVFVDCASRRIEREAVDARCVPAPASFHFGASFSFRRRGGGGGGGGVGGGRFAFPFH